MSEMKSAWEKALEKVEKLGKPSDEELKQLEHVPVGNRLAAAYLREESYDMEAELAKYKDTEIRKHIIQGAEEIFLRNITLPNNDQVKQAAKKAMSGIRILKENKKQLEAIFDRIENLLTYYEQARQQALAQFKQSFEAKIQQTAQALQQQGGNTAAIEQQLQQQFQEEWHRVSSQLDAQYEQSLKEHKQQITAIT